MDVEDLLLHVKSGEGISTEFKRCGNKVEDDTFETICSFANRQGGNIFLGVTDAGEIAGVNSRHIAEIKRNIINVLNNPRCFNAAPLVETEEIGHEDGTVIRIWVPMGPIVYSYKNQVYDRLADVDVRISGVDQLSLLYLRKQNIYSERRIYQYVGMDDLRPDLVARARDMAASQSPAHPWTNMSDEELLRSAKLFIRDRVTGEEGLTLASVLLLGNDDVIGDVCPAYKTDAVVRKADKKRYDDRLVVKTNLIDSFYLLDEFAKRHLPDRFVLEGSTRVSARDIIIRELVVNTLIHREYISPFPAKLIIEEKRMFTENASRAFYEGRLTLSDFNPMSKNPIIASFFSNIGLAEELGSGMRNLTAYSLQYSGEVPVLRDGDIFTASVPLPAAEKTSGVVSVENLVFSIIERDGNVTSNSLSEAANVTTRTAQRHLKRMVEAGKLEHDSNTPHAYIRKI